MEQSFGKLILLSDDGPEQEYELGKTRVTLGRATTNDIVLPDRRASRSHARLECSPAGCTLADLGSSNGSYVNGQRVQRLLLQPGDEITMGGARFRFAIAPLTEQAGMTVIDRESDLDQAMNQEVLPFAINETSQPRLVIMTPLRTWELPVGDVDTLSIGRTEANQLVLEHPKVSRNHAEIQCRSGIYVLRDLNSTNGTWHREERIDQLILQDGDEFRIGEATLLFKSGFEEESLTMADDIRPTGSARRIVVFVPGMMGSELWRGSERIFPNVKTLFTNPEILQYPKPLEPRKIVDQVVIVPNLVKLDQYNRLGDYLVEELGYQRAVDFFEFPYDWRQDVRTSAQQLGALVESLPRTQPIIIIAHSLGTMVSRYYIERLGGKKRIERVILMGGPHQGVVKALTSLLNAPEVLPFGLMGERLRQVSMSFPSSYQILPVYPLQVDQGDSKVNFLEEDNWLPDMYKPLLRAASEFRRELGMRSSIPAISIFGYGLKTIAGLSIQKNSAGVITKVDYRTELNGDSTILESSTVLPGSEIHPVQQYHGSLFVDNDVKMRLKLELTRPFAR
ncbi:MAG: FHA domain-containing protein [Anaerolineales bacterium]|jgi:pSer/pThr/pTyr-binding forkhead associated (FHA) protein|nr:FHA domain-containing protein [Anaerolineales bacterium]